MPAGLYLESLLEILDLTWASMIVSDTNGYYKSFLSHFASLNLVWLKAKLVEHALTITVNLWDEPAHIHIMVVIDIIACTYFLIL